MVKKINLTDKIVIGIIVFNMISFALGFTFYDVMTVKIGLTLWVINRRFEDVLKKFNKGVIYCEE